MQLTKRLAAVFLVVGLCAGGMAHAQSTADARQVVTRAAEALGGVDRIQALKTIRLRGYGHDPYQDGGSLITTEPTAPEKMTIITAYERVIDLANGRTRVRGKQSRAFVFAAEAMMAGRPIDQALDGDVAFDVAPGGAARRLSKEVATQRRMELLANPIVAVRAALDSAQPCRESAHGRRGDARRRHHRGEQHVHARRDDGHGPPALGAVGRARTRTSATSRTAPSSAATSPSMACGCR